MNRPRIIRISDRLYRTLLVAYPLEFRRRFGEEMCLVFRDSCRDALQDAGAEGMFRLWISTFLDLAATASKERLLSIGYRSATMIDISTFDSQLNVTLDMWIARLREGYSVGQIIEMTASSDQEPAAGEFKQVLQEVQTGKAIPEAFAALQERVPSENLGKVINTMNTQFQEGGNLADRLEQLKQELN